MIATNVAALMLFACSHDEPLFVPTEVAAPKMVVRIIAGDRQFGQNRDTLRPVVAEVTDLNGVPQRDIEVTWTVNDDGIIKALAPATDDSGHVRAIWTLGDLGDHDGIARAAGGAAGAFSAAEPAVHVLELQEPALLRPQTYEYSRETVHPDFVRTPSGWGAYSEHLALTPYPNSMNAVENPSMFVSRLGYRWFPQAGMKNPVVAPAGPPGAAYLSDPDVVYVPQSRELWLYYRQVDSKNRVLLVRSADGTDWSEPVQVVEVKNHQAISPSVVRKDATSWFMWTVNGGSLGCGGIIANVQLRKSHDGVHWSKATNVALQNGRSMPWHIEVQWIPEVNQFWALYPVKEPGSCATRELHLATSTDGITWQTYPTPVLEAGELPMLADIVYRSTFEYDAKRDEVRFWFSGANADGNRWNWRTVLQRRSRSALFAQVNAVHFPPVGPTPTRVLPVMLNPP
ncbi:MAG: hypothetical protein ABI852_03395 [Gemmatimonadaceae bacterium]